MEPTVLYGVRNNIQDNGILLDMKKRGMCSIEDWQVSEIKVLRTEEELRTAFLLGYHVYVP